MEWQHSLLGCFDNIGLCLITYIAPCYTFAKNAEAVGEDCCLCGLLYFIPPINFYAAVSLRRTIRHSRGIEGNLCGDILHSVFCPFCSMIQEAKELKTPTLLNMHNRLTSTPCNQISFQSPHSLFRSQLFATSTSVFRNTLNSTLNPLSSHSSLVARLKRANPDVQMQQKQQHVQDVQDVQLNI